MALVILTERDNRRSVQASPGDEIALRLPETPTTGFRWRVDLVEGTLEPAGDSFELGTQPQFGSGGIRELRFRVRGPGRIELRHWQEWEGDSSITERYAVDIVPAS